MPPLRQRQGFSLRSTGRRHGGGAAVPLNAVIALVGSAFCLLFLVGYLAILSLSGSEDDGGGGVRTSSSSVRAGANRIPGLGRQHNAIAIDVIKTLDCGAPIPKTNYWGGGGGGGDDAFLRSGDGIAAEEEAEAEYEEAGEGGVGGGGGAVDDLVVRGRRGRRRRRRLDEVDGGGRWNDDAGNGDRASPDAEGAADAEEERMGDPWADDFGGGGGGGDAWGPGPELTAKHLFCLAAGAEDLPPEAREPDAFACGVVASYPQTLLDLWSSARSQIPLDVLKKSLDLAVERPYALAGKDVNLWAPQGDEGLTYTLSELADAGTVGDFANLKSALGPGKLFVDVGSGLGLVSMAISLLYPGTAVISIEPAAPSWIMQGLNMRCNLPIDANHPTAVLSGIGHKNGEMSKMMWRPQATTSTRAWTPAEEHSESDVELIVRLRTLRSIVGESLPATMDFTTPISVLNLDCGGCEYNLIPAMSDTDFDKIENVVGNLHWGYIPPEKLPSSKRGEQTHKKLCRHPSFATKAIECCAFPDLEVKDRPGDDGGYDADQSTVKDLAGNLCDKFDEWAKDKNLYGDQDDYGWFELTSMAGEIKKP